MSGTSTTPASGNGSSAASSTATDTAAQAAAATATTAATTQTQAQTPASPPDPVAAAAAGALSALLDIAGDQDADDMARVAACELIQKYCDDATVHALINSVPPAPSPAGGC